MEKVVSCLNWKAFHVVCVFCAALMIPMGNAFQYKVGGGRGSWAVPNDPNDAVYNQWAEKSRFLIGDTLLFVYDANHDSVLHVTKEDYTNCKTDTPLEKFSDGYTVFPLNQSGPFYFISGVSDNCHKKQKLAVVVMADRGNHKSNDVVYPPPASPAVGVPPPSLEVPPAPLGVPPPGLGPVVGGSPPPPGQQLAPPALAPVGGESPPPPGEGLPPPSVAPAAEEPPVSPTNNAVSAVISSGAIFAASMWSMFVLAV